MKILQVSTYDVSGGAARATYRLHKGLREIGHDCRMLVRHKDARDDGVVVVDAQEMPENPNEDFFLSTIIQPYYINSNQTELSNTLFSLSYPGYDLSELPPVQSADIINLHWVAQYQSVMTLKQLFSLKKPVVWTLHDQWAFTGGCHYSAGCDKYQADCLECPQLSDDPFNLPAAVLRDKLSLFKNADLTIVTPSRWMAACARKSSLFKDLRIEVIPNSLETATYMPLPKAQAKEELGVSPEAVTLLFGAVDGSEKRKGFLELADAIKSCLDTRIFQQLLHDDKIRLVCFGRPSPEIKSIGIPVVALGHLDTDEKIRGAYSAADIFLLPSLEDNLPNTILESMSCGTPVVAFDVGGLPDMIIDGVTGRLVPLSDTRKMGETIIDLIQKPNLRMLMAEEGRKRVETEYALRIQARRYADLYNELRVGDQPDSQGQPVGSGNGSVWGDMQGSETFSVPVTTAIGPYFRKIYDQVLMKALRRIPVSLNILDGGQVKNMEQQVRDLHIHLEARLVQIQTLTGMVNAAEAAKLEKTREIEGLKTILEERARDINSLHAHINSLHTQINSLNTEHAQCLENIDKLTEWLKDAQQQYAELSHRFAVRAMKKIRLI